MLRELPLRSSLRMPLAESAFERLIVLSLLSHPISCDLISHENHSAHHEQRIRHERVLKKSGARPPHAQANEHCRQRQALSNLHSNVEADDVRNQAVLGKRELLKLCRQSKTVKQPEYQNGDFRVRLKSKESLESVHVVEGFVDNREPDNRIHDVRV